MSSIVRSAQNFRTVCAWWLQITAEVAKQRREWVQAIRKLAREVDAVCLLVLFREAYGNITYFEMLQEEQTENKKYFLEPGLLLFLLGSVVHYLCGSRF